MLILFSVQNKALKVHNNQAGTSLIEVLVSIFIILLIFQLTYIIAFSTSLTVQSRHNTSASLYAVSLIEAIRAAGTIDVGSCQIEEDEELLGITPPDGMEAHILVTPVEDNLFLTVVKITVSWVERDQFQQLKIDSIVRRDLD